MNTCRFLDILRHLQSQTIDTVGMLDDQLDHSQFPF